ncbi:MAG: ATP-binding protein, partial [Ectothiorhodospiraceae bacterium]
IQQSAEALENWQHIYRVRGPGGGYRWMAGRARPESLSDGSILWHGYIHDIDEQERARQALALSEQRLRSLFKFAPVGIALSDFETGRFLDANEALLQPSGYTWGEFVHLSHGAVTPAEYQADERKAVEDLGTMGQYGPLEEEYLRKDGSRYPVRVQGMVSREPDGRQVIWSLVEDITERRRIETMKDQFIATVSHELRTPLTAINGSLDLLVGGAAGSLPDKAERLLANAQRNGKRLGDLINDLLDMEKLVAGRMPMKREPLAVGPIVSDAIEAMTEFARQHGVGINAPDDSLSAQVHVDPARLIQAITNLLSNAIKFSPVGQAVDVDIEPDGADVAIVVRDYGPGVDPSFRDQLFTRFAREDSANNRRLAGTGLGLSITREIVEQMGGAVAYQDAARGGSRFLICLPVVAPH